MSLHYIQPWTPVGIMSEIEDGLRETKALYLEGWAESHSPSAPAQRQHFQNCLGHRGGTKLTNLRAKAGGTGVGRSCFRGQKLWRVLFFLCCALLLSSLSWGSRHEISLSINLANTVCPALAFPWDPAPYSQPTQPAGPVLAAPHPSLEPGGLCCLF